MWKISLIIKTSEGMFTEQWPTWRNNVVPEAQPDHIKSFFSKIFQSTTEKHDDIIKDDIYSSPPSFQSYELPFKSKVADWWNSWKPSEGSEIIYDKPTDNITITDRFNTTLTPSQLPAKETSLARADPRLVPSVIYDMECIPGTAFHGCIQECTSSSIPIANNKAGTYKETETFRDCVRNCTDALLNVPGPGCLNEDGTLIERNPSGMPSTFNPSQIKFKAIAYRMRNMFNIPFSGVIYSNLYPVIHAAVIIGLIYVVNTTKCPELLFIVLNGLPTNSISSSNHETEKWAQATDYHQKYLGCLNYIEVKCDSLAVVVVDLLHNIFNLLKMAQERNEEGPSTVVQGLRPDEDVMNRISGYELTQFNSA